MGLLDTLALSRRRPEEQVASLVFYGRESFCVERQPRDRINQWRNWLDSRHFGVVALGYARPGELESQLVERLDAFAFQEVRRIHSSAEFKHCDLLITGKGAESSGSVVKLKPRGEAANAIVQLLEQCDRAPAPWEQITLLILSDVLQTWNWDEFLEDSVPERELPRGMAPELVGRYQKAREAAVKEFGLLRSEDLARGVHSSAGNTSLVASKWRRGGEIFAVNYGGKPGYLGFQFDPQTSRPRPVISEILRAFPKDPDGWRLALWFTSANPRLSNRRPVDVLDQNPEQVIAAAKG